MLSYQHGYHAGNFADVVKHLSLTQILSYLRLKEKAFFYLETHAGKGLYDLQDKQAIKTGESNTGIKLLWPDSKKLAPIFSNYIQVISALNKSEKSLRYYPGSPYLAINALRAQDRAYLCELHPTEHEALHKIPHLHKKVHVSNTDGIAIMKALLPPPEKRGLIFLDPSYEIKEEYKLIPKAIQLAFKRFSTGVYCLWYPLVDKKLTEQLNRGMQNIQADHALKIEFSLTAAPQEGMTGCGLWIINPPYTFATEIKKALAILKTYFNPGVSSYIVEDYSKLKKSL